MVRKSGREPTRSRGADDRWLARRRLQSLVDLITCVFLTVLVWPFPIARATMSVSSQVMGVGAVLVAGLATYFVVASALWGQTLGMRLAGLELASTEGGALSRSQAVRWGILASLLVWWFIAVPSAARRAQTVEEASGVALRSVD